MSPHQMFQRLGDSVSVSWAINCLAAMGIILLTIRVSFGFGFVGPLSWVVDGASSVWLFGCGVGHVVGEVSESILLLAECLQFQLVGATSTGIDTMQQTLLGRLLELKGLSPTTDLDLSVSTDGEDLLPFAADTVEIVGQELSLFADVGGLGGFTVLLGTVFGLCWLGDKVWALAVRRWKR